MDLNSHQVQQLLRFLQLKKILPTYDTVNKSSRCQDHDLYPAHRNATRGSVSAIKYLTHKILHVLCEVKQTQSASLSRGHSYLKGGTGPEVQNNPDFLLHISNQSLIIYPMRQEHTAGWVNG